MPTKFKINTNYDREKMMTEYELISSMHLAFTQNAISFIMHDYIDLDSI